MIIGVVLFTGGVTILAVIVIPGMFGMVIIPLVEVMAIIEVGFGTIVVAGGTEGSSGGS